MPNDPVRSRLAHAAMVSLHFMYYNFARPHSALGKNTTPATRLSRMGFARRDTADVLAKARKILQTAELGLAAIPFS